MYACRRKLTARIAELENEADAARQRAAKLEKEKIKLTIEIRDLAAELESVRTNFHLTNTKSVLFCCMLRYLKTRSSM